MRIQQLSIQHFRNIPQMEFAPDSGANIIYGDNAQGKTNLLEAIWLFTGSRSFRRAKDSEYIQFQASTARVSLDFYAEDREQTASLAWGKSGKQVKLNDVKQPGTGALSGHFCSVVFSPDHLTLIKQGPEHRRRMIDASLCQAFPKYGRALEGYSKTLRQRNVLLRDVAHNSSLLDTLDVWDHNLVEYGSYIAAMRAGYIQKLRALASGFYEGISSGKEALGMEYVSGIGLPLEARDRDSLREMLSRQLRSNRGEEIRSGISEIGPHRDDLNITIDNRPARSFGSQGQQRSCILAIKLAECGILEERNGEAPVVMLDDVMSELDEHRRGYLLNQLTGRQVLITCCDAGDFASLQNGKVFHIRDGVLL